MREEYIKKAAELRHTLHMHPELSGHEHKTMNMLIRFISDNTSLYIEKRDGWFYALKECPYPKEGAIAFRADMDALPINEGSGLSYASVNAGVSHKCGHDGHCAALCAFALALDGMEVARSVYLIFQPAEETGLGAAVCAPLLREKSITEVYAFHNLGGYEEGEIIYRRGLTQPASEGLTLRFSGKTSHASEPENGKNPAEAISRLALYTKTLLNEAHAGIFMCTVAGIKVGNGDFGISPGHGEIRLTLRAEYESELISAKERLINKAREFCKADGLSLEHESSDCFPETKNDAGCLEKVIKAAETLGLPAREMDRIWLASEDFGNYTKVCPGAIFYIGNGSAYPALHTAEYDFNDRIIPAAAEMFIKLSEM
ncbi:MAG: amidohydrolase [Clostridia bacterium]|nr:amidohydrolase [Clostridia bacterium]